MSNKQNTQPKVEDKVETKVEPKVETAHYYQEQMNKIASDTTKRAEFMELKKKRNNLLLK